MTSFVSAISFGDCPRSMFQAAPSRRTLVDSPAQAMPRRAGFTLVELLVAMALIVLIMAILSQAFVEGLETFRHLKGLGDLEESLRTDAQALTDEVDAAGTEAWQFIADSLRSGTGDPDEAAALRRRYERICARAEDLQARLGAIHPTNRAAERALRQTLDLLSQLKLSAQTMIELLRLFEVRETG